ncbi:MAG TPA: tetratricopeptide repeat protein, partial [Thermoanaerobaculia bacterium]|nr:tetratricopeptide repeat protein [Thermoanaerobaculia bacterium]
MENETALLDLIGELTSALTAGRRDRAREIAVRLEERLRATLPDGSRDLDDLLDTIGRACTAIDDPEETLQVFRRLAVDQTELAGLLMQRGGPTPEARALLVGAVDIQRRVADPDEVSLATTLGRLGLHYQRRGETREALPLFEESLRLRRHALPENAPEIADAFNNVGIAHLELGDLAAARHALQQAEALLLAWEVPDRFRLVFIDTNLADLDRQTGHYADAEHHARRATENAIELFGEQHPHTAAALNSLALVHQATGRLVEALSLIERVVQVRRAQRSSAPLEEILALNNLGTMRASLGMYDDALAALREACERAVVTVGENHPLTAGTLDNQAQIHRLTGRSKIGIELARRAVEIRRTAQGERHRDFAGSLSGLARLLMDEKQYNEAETVQLQAIAIEREILGPDHIRCGIDLGTLGTIYRQTGRVKEAEETDRLALEITIRAVGPDHGEVATQLVNLASDADQLGDLETAIDLARDAVEIGRRALGEAHPESITGLYNLAALLVKRGNFLEAQPLAAEALEIARRTLRPDQREYSYALGKLSDIQEELGNYALAEALLHEKLELDTRAFGEADPRNALLLSALAGVCRENGKLPEAAGYAARSVAMLREHGGESDPRYRTVLSNEALVDLVRGDYALARQKLLEVQEIEARAFGPSAETFGNLGTVYKEAGLYAEAEECYRRALEIAERAAGPNPRGTAVLLNNLAMLRSERGDFTEAERLLLQSRDVNAKTIG